MKHRVVAIGKLKNEVSWQVLPLKRCPYLSQFST